MGVGRPGSAAERKIFLLFEGGENQMYEGVYLAVFNLKWLLNNESLGKYLSHN
jgi:hypothetical protein